PLSDKDRSEIRKQIDEKVLRAQPIAFHSSAVESSNGQLTVRGELTVAGMTRPGSFGLELAADGRVSGTLPVTQSEWGIKPYRGFMGALKVRDSVEVIIDVRLRTDSAFRRPHRWSIAPTCALGSLGPAADAERSRSACPLVTVMGQLLNRG